MAARVLTVQAIERMKPDAARRAEIPDATLPGLYFVVQPSGAKSWAVRYRHAGKTRKMTLGTYPALDLARAREQGRAALHLVSLGRDPAQEREAAKAVPAPEPDRDLVSTVVESFIERHVRKKNRPRTAEETTRLLRSKVLPAWGTKRIHEIGRRDIIELLDQIVDAGTPIAANRTLSAVSKLFNWCMDRGILDANPCVRVRAPAAETSRERVLEEAEIRVLWRACNEIGWPFGPFVQLLLLTAQRRDEVAKMRRSELREGGTLWTIPGERSKNGVVHDVPLSGAAQSLLTSQPRVAGKSGYVFTTTGRTAISGYAKAKARLDATMLAILKRVEAERGGETDSVMMTPWRLHDLRRTATTGMAKLGHPVHVTEAVLNHHSGTISGVAAIYNRHQYLDEKRAALEAWARHVSSLIQENEA
ncbi:tyrosine-type recombinase/integrase [Methylobacterium dankookense]|uniref:Prophage integrase IntS n=1 Tax=Methylobacterium dankookense TaxID=560405 RepID=A0A564G2F1_9HYPH|nr:site-specific integrase [Methylobacterium dankookense]GJD58842.1 Prophage integrase IntS [Methylobacterium dankookense]VUF14186.1 Prophage integrase IntS [Methylobacterium dankookense]